MGQYENIQHLERQPIRIIDIYVHDEKTSIIDYHYHRSLEIILPIIGSVKIYCNGKSEIVDPGDIYIVNSSDMHYISGQLDEGYYKGYAFQIPYSILEYCEANIDSFRFINTKNVHPKIIRILYQILLTDINNPKYKHIAMLQNTLEIVKTLLLTEKEEKKHNEVLANQQKGVIMDILEYMKEHYQEGLTVQRMACYFNYSYGHFEKMFKENTGMKVMDCLREIQVQAVEKLLVTTENSIVTISEKTGFPNVKSLQRYFKKKHHTTAQQYRNNMRK